ncbi:hypothetical protein Poli38472_000446 [Pythium oligandrum]|uniref:Uncharacterized protein n=1 Tax=Pythium oligandrum TaxID=41045 RepID=A0A8K1FGV6_PYTOL|nr:hypothetical protein Poli38472_000446 [Pythium oligandrum]|eukprot:TMW60404.1 hypothetical protein Poli38472_000446 [Pythium oligandrum]
MTARVPRVPRVPVTRKPKSNAGVAAFATLVGAGFFSIPFLAHFLKGENLNSREKPLNATQIRRGVYLNTGSRDVGVDKDWDFSTYTWQGRRGDDVRRNKTNKDDEDKA